MSIHLKKSFYGRYFPMAHLLRVPAMLALSAFAARAATFTVTNLADAGAGSLRQAIINANNGAGADVIDFAAGVTGSVTLASEVPGLAGGISLQGPGAGLLTVETVQQSSPFRIFNVPPGATASLAGITIRRSSTAYGQGHGGGVANFGSLTLTNCVLENNVVSKFQDQLTTLDPSRGGGIFNAVGASLVVEGCTFRENRAVVDNGGAICNEGTATVSNSTFSDNNRGSFPSLLHAIWNKAGVMTLDGVTVTLNAGGLNLTLDTALAAASANNFTSGNPLLGPLQDNDGRTPTHRPLVPLAPGEIRNASSCMRS